MYDSCRAAVFGRYDAAVVGGIGLCGLPFELIEGLPAERGGCQSEQQGDAPKSKFFIIGCFFGYGRYMFLSSSAGSNPNWRAIWSSGISGISIFFLPQPTRAVT